MASEKNYTISTPYYSVKDAPAGALQTKSLEDMQAERYFTDVYHIFLSQLTQIAQKSEVSSSFEKRS